MTSTDLRTRSALPGVLPRPPSVPAFRTAFRVPTKDGAPAPSGAPSGASPAPATPAPGADRGRWWCAAGGAAVAVVLVMLAHRGLGDDSYITLDYARTLVEHGEWGLVPGRSSNTATSPLNVWLLGAVLAPTGSPTAAVGAVLVAAFVLVAVWSRALGRAVGLGTAFPVVAVALLATSPLLVSTIGLETYLGVALLVGVARYAREDRAAAAGLLCGAMVLVRPDYLVPAIVVAVAVVPRAASWRARARWVGVAARSGAVVAAPWHLWAWCQLGGFLPDTFAFKTGNPHGRLPAMIAEYDALYWSRTPVATAVTTAVVLAGWACAAGWGVRRPRSAVTPVVVGFALAGTAHWCALMVLHSYPQAWYYGPLVAGCALAVAATVAAWVTAAAAAVLAAYCTLALAAAGQGGLPWTAAEMNSNFTTAAYYAQVGRDLPALVGNGTVAPPGEIGALAWYCSCPTLDQFSDRALARPLIERRLAHSGPTSRAVLALNGAFRASSPSPRIDYRLRYVRGVEVPPPGVLHTWWVRSPQSGLPFRIVLVRA